jgi:hypothetical protein
MTNLEYWPFVAPVNWDITEFDGQITESKNINRRLSYLVFSNNIVMPGPSMPALPKSSSLRGNPPFRFTTYDEDGYDDFIIPSPTSRLPSITQKPNISTKKRQTKNGCVYFC